MSLLSGRNLALVVSIMMVFSNSGSAQSGCDFGPSYDGATWSCVGGSANGAPCSAPGDSVCVGGSCQISTGGRATYYDFTGNGNCGLDSGPPGTYVTAISTPDWDGSAMCGRCLEVTGPLGTIIVKVVDQCPAGSNPQWCADGGHLDLDYDAFAAIANPAQGVIEAAWRTVPCEWSRNVKLVNKDGVNPWWYAVFIEDHRHGIDQVEIHDADSSTWVQAIRQNYNAFVVTNIGEMNLPLSARVTDVTGAVVETSNVVTNFNDYSEFDMGVQLPICIDILFADGFESGDTTKWSVSIP